MVGKPLHYGQFRKIIAIVEYDIEHKIAGLIFLIADFTCVWGNHYEPERSLPWEKLTKQSIYWSNICIIYKSGLYVLKHDLTIVIKNKGTYLQFCSRIFIRQRLNESVNISSTPRYQRGIQMSIVWRNKQIRRKMVS